MTERLNNSPRVPLSSNRLVDANEFSQLLEVLRISVPSSIRDSERTLAEREEILERADEEARRILAQAQKRASELLAADHLVQAARKEAERIVGEAHQAAARSAEDADAYAEYVLNAINDTLESAGGQVANGLEELTLRRAERAAHMSAYGQQGAQRQQAPQQAAQSASQPVAQARQAAQQAPAAQRQPVQAPAQQGPSQQAPSQQGGQRGAVPSSHRPDEAEEAMG